MRRRCVTDPVVIPFPARTPPARRIGARLEIHTRAERLEIILLDAATPQRVTDPQAALHHILASVLG